MSGQQKRVYIAPDDHTDYFWTADNVQYEQAFLTTLDYYLDLADTTQTNAAPYQSRWNCDGHLWMWTYEKNRTPAQFQRLIDRIADGHVSVPLNALCVCLGAAPAEAVLRGMYYPGKIERQYDVRFRLAYLIENQTQPLGIASLWAGSGAKYSWKGICGCDSQVSNPHDREHDMYRAQGPDGAEILIKWNSMLNGNENMGGYAEARSPTGVVDFVTVNAPFNGFAARYPYDVIGCFGKGWDDLQTQTSQFVTTAQNMSNASRQVIVSNEQDFFADFEQTYNVAALPAKSVSFGNEWELYSAGMAEVTARAKRAVEKLRAAEAMTAVVSLFEPEFMNGREPARDRAYMNWGLFWEHDFGMVGPQTGSLGIQKRITWQHLITDEIELYVNTLHDDSADALADLIPIDGANPRYYVFNPLSWSRDAIADLPYAGPSPIHIIDVASQLELPSQIVSIDGQAHLRVLVEDIPSVGYRVLEIRDGSGQSFSNAAMVTPDGNSQIIENSIYRVTFATNGAITSLIDKMRSDREFAQGFSGRVMNDLGASTGTITIENVGPVSVTLKAVADLPVLHTSRVTLYRGVDRIDIENEITQNFSTTRTYAFGFNITSPAVRHEEVGAILRASLVTDGGDYSPRNARYDWLTLNHFADITGSEGVGVTLSNSDASFFKLGNSTPGLLDTSTPSIAVLAGGKVANGGNGIPNQGGDTSFTNRFALRTHDAYGQQATMKMALEHQNPPVCRMVTAGNPRLPSDHFSAVQLSNANVLLWAFKLHEDGADQGLVARLWNQAETPQSTDLQISPRAIESAVSVTHIETDVSAQSVGPAGITTVLARQQIQSFRLMPMATGHCGDFDADNDVDSLDLAVFVNVLIGADMSSAHAGIADINQDGMSDGNDVSEFVDCLLGN
ncbi:MAG: glycoside hydrolase [Planctomycetes bacterium]|nr:glycoside hydrolase [Planctomycetota bacterium]